MVRQMISRVLKDGTYGSRLLAFANAEPDDTIEKIKKYRPYLIFLGMTNREVNDDLLLKTIVQLYPEIPVVVLANLNQEGARRAIHALKMGAFEYVTVPENIQGVVFAEKHFKKRLLYLIKALPYINMRAGQRDQLILTRSSSVATQRKFKQRESVDLVVINGSIGGVQSLYSVISSIKDMSVPAIIVQHMPKIFTKELAEDLDSLTSNHVREAEQNSILLPGQIYVAPGGQHTILKNTGSRKIIKTHRGFRELNHRPSIDVLLRSAVKIYQNRMLVVFLSGCGKDGIKGAEQVLAAGGQVIVQSKRSSGLWDLPGNVHSLHKRVKQYHRHQLGEQIILRVNDRDNSKITTIMDMEHQ